jgi:hypothetical protein
MRERQMREPIAQRVEASDVVVDRRLCLLVEGLEKLAHGLSAIGISAVNGVEK